MGLGKLRQISGDCLMLLIMALMRHSVVVYIIVIVSRRVKENTKYHLPNEQAKIRWLVDSKGKFFLCKQINLLRLLLYYLPIAYI